MLNKCIKLIYQRAKIEKRAKHDETNKKLLIYIMYMYVHILTDFLYCLKVYCIIVRSASKSREQITCYTCMSEALASK